MTTNPLLWIAAILFVLLALSYVTYPDDDDNYA